MTAAIASLKRTLCCVGITRGTDKEDIPWIADFYRDPIVCPDGHDSIELVVEGYEQGNGKDMPKSKLVTIKLLRAGCTTPLLAFIENNANLSGIPQLKWAELDIA